jgi:cytochrome P450
LIGNLLHLRSSHPHVALWNLAKKHGPVMHLRLGHVDTVVISSPAAAQEVLQEKDLIFASRPKMFGPEILLDGMDIAMAPYGAYWRNLRKLCMTVLLAAHKVRQLGPLRDRETISLVRKVGAAGQGGEPVNLGELVVSCSIAITWHATLGQMCSGKLLEQFMSVVDVAVKEGGGFCTADLFPSLWFVDVVTGLRRRLRRARRQLDDVFDKIITEHKARKRQEEEKITTADDDLLTVMLRMKEEQDLEIPMTSATIQAVLFVSVQIFRNYYSLQPILIFANIDVSKHIVVVDTFILAKSNMDHME